MSTKPTLWNRMVAVLSGEIPADTLEAYRRASLAVYDQLDHAENHRAQGKVAGKNPWTLAPAVKAELLCSWNAFVLQNLGDQFLDADYAGNPSTRGFVLPITGDQILSFYNQVEGWLNRAQQAHYNPDYKLDVAVPADLPPWSEVEPCPNAHLRGMLEAMHSIRDHAGAAMIFLTETTAPTGEAHLKQMRYIQQLFASASSKARYADDLHGSDPSREVHERVEPHVKEAIEKFYALGQLLAMPELVDDYQRRAANGTVPPISGANPAGKPTLPHEKGFDPWCLTDPKNIVRFKADDEARAAIATLWKLDPNPTETLRIKAEIDAAMARGDIRFASDRYGQRLGHFFCAPWSPVYEVVRSTRIGGTALKTMQQFIYNVTCEGVNLGAPFTREIMVGTFNPTTRFEYGDPDEEPDH